MGPLTVLPATPPGTVGTAGALATSLLSDSSFGQNIAQGSLRSFGLEMSALVY